MGRFAIRRLLWSILSFLVLSVVVFVLTNLVASDQEAKIPWFINTHPEDVKSRTDVALAQLESEPTHEEGAHKLVVIGGAALPLILTQFDEMSQSNRQRVSTALAPMLPRMGLADELEKNTKNGTLDPMFWVHFWEEHAVDYTEMSLGRALSRFTKYPTAENERELLVVDTYGLVRIIPLIFSTTDPVVRDALSRVASRIAEREGRIPASASADEVRRGISEWRDFWRRNRSNYRDIEGAERLTALVSETRYGRWLTRTFSGDLGGGAFQGARVRGEIGRTLPRTLIRASLAVLLAMASSFALLFFVKERTDHRRPGRYGVEIVQVFSIPCILTFQNGGGFSRNFAALLAAVFFLFPLAFRMAERTLMDLLGDPAFTTARAMGASENRALIYGFWPRWLSLTLMLLVPLLPLAVEISLVSELVLHLGGAGTLVAAASRLHDGARMTGIVLVLAALFMALHLAVDLVVRFLDPRLRDEAPPVGTG